MDLSNAKLTMGPVLFNWKPETWRDFYFRVADEAPVDTVYIGEVVCSKRQPFFEPVFPEVLERLLSSGKEVVLSTMALIMNKREMQSVRDIAGMDDMLVEANDVSGAALLAGRPHVIGPFVNIYNEGTVAYFADKGAKRFALPVELPLASIGKLAEATDAEMEVQAFGRLPLAVSARCYHARHHGLHKDGCQFVCDKSPDGMDLDTLDGEAFLAVNGIQTMSYTYANLIGDLDSLAGAGVSHFRLSPHSCDMVAVAQTFRDYMDGRAELGDAYERLEDLCPEAVFSNGYLYGREGYLAEGRLAEMAE
ncbi:ubiquinone anaerobic biosynthesis protein UbiV [Aestuariispira ectoiniformans]|uniref:ubiquinone anaerobic biosynthesis protein UbiV n=1 Tax=Aestuariispira ectoiniformans TaxID=2775080 RepID=UPI00223B2A93|nr:U32 family peptidase [Aestuariispira ectoiniformans]